MQACLDRKSKRRRGAGDDSGDLSNSLQGYLAGHRRTVSYFATLLDTSVFGEWMAELDAAAASWQEERGRADRSGFDKMQHMRTPEFAEQAASSLHLATMWK